MVLFCRRAELEVVVAIACGGNRKSSSRVARLEYFHGFNYFAAREWGHQYASECDVRASSYAKGKGPGSYSCCAILRVFKKLRWKARCSKVGSLSGSLETQKIHVFDTYMYSSHKLTKKYTDQYEIFRLELLP